MSIFPAISVIVFVNFLISVENKPVVDKVPSIFTITFPEIDVVKVCEKKVQEFTATLLVVPIIELFIKILIGFPDSPVPVLV